MRVVVVLVVAASLLVASASTARARGDEPQRPVEPPVVVTGPPPPLPGEPAPEVPEPPKDPRKNGALEISLSAASFTANLEDERFHGEGVPRESTERVTFAERGGDLGVSSPRFWGGELRASYMRRYFSAGASFFAAGGTGGADVQPARPDRAELASPSGLYVLGGAVHLFLALPFDRVTLKVGADLGIRSFAMPLSGFDPKTCTSNSRRTGRVSYPCSENAWTNVLPFLHPQVRIEVALDRGKQLFVGPSIGFDALGGSGVLGAFTFGFRTEAHDDLKP